MEFQKVFGMSTAYTRAMTTLWTKNMQLSQAMAVASWRNGMLLMGVALPKSARTGVQTTCAKPATHTAAPRAKRKTPSMPAPLPMPASREADPKQV